MASSRVGNRMSARMGPRLPLVLGTEVASMRWIIGIRKLRVLPVPVDAVARMSLPSSAGGMAFACTGVGFTKPAWERRDFRESEMLKSVKRTSVASGRLVDFPVTVAVWLVAVCCSVGSRIAEVKIGPYGVGVAHRGAGVPRHHGFT